MNARFEALSGGASKRAFYYLAGRFLHMTPREWDELPWWVQRVYLEGFQAEGFLSDGTTPKAGTVDDFHGALSGQPGELSALGFTEQTL